MTEDNWVVTITFDVDPVMDLMDSWESELEHLDCSATWIPRLGVDVTVHAGDLPILEAVAKMSAAVQSVVDSPMIAVEVVSETEWRRRPRRPAMFPARSARRRGRR